MGGYGSMKNVDIKDKSFDLINYLILAVVTFMALIPLLATIAISFSSRAEVEMKTVSLWPKGFTFDSWSYMIFRPDLWKAFGLTVFVTIIGTVLALFITALLAYPLSKKDFKIGKYLMILIVVTMVFKYPIIPYFLVLKNMGLYDSPLVLILPHILSAYNLIIMRTFFAQFPRELEEAGLVEGCGFTQILFRLVLPTSKPVLASLALFYGVVIWNQFQHPLMFIQNPDYYPLQLKIRQFVVDGNEFNLSSLIQQNINYNGATLRATVVIFALVPVIAAYPFAQKYFVKGAMLGSVKG